MGGPREGGDFQNLHRNKRSMTLNLKAPEGLAAFKRMVKKADVVVENFRPDVKKRLGIDYKALAKINPRLVYASISGFGQDGPYAGRPGFDQIAQGMGGLMSITGLPGQGPVRVGIPIADLSAGLFAALGILVALAGAREIAQGPAHRDLAAAGADFHARFSGRALSGQRRSGQAGRQQSSDQHSDRRVQDQRRPHQHRRHRAENLGAILRGRRGDGAPAESGLSDAARRVRKIATRSMPRSTPISSAAPAPTGSSASTKPACRAGRSMRSTRCSPIRRSSISAWRKA